MQPQKISLKMQARAVLRASALLLLLALSARAGDPAKLPPVQVGNVFPHLTVFAPGVGSEPETDTTATAHFTYN